eukprot:403346853
MLNSKAKICFSPWQPSISKTTDLLELISIRLESQAKKTQVHRVLYLRSENEGFYGPLEIDDFCIFWKNLTLPNLKMPITFDFMKNLMTHFHDHPTIFGPITFYDPPNQCSIPKPKYVFHHGSPVSPKLLICQSSQVSGQKARLRKPRFIESYI